MLSDVHVCVCVDVLLWLKLPVSGLCVFNMHLNSEEANSSKLLQRAKLQGRFSNAARLEVLVSLSTLGSRLRPDGNRIGQKRATGRSDRLEDRGGRITSPLPEE